MRDAPIPLFIGCLVVVAAGVLALGWLVLSVFLSLGHYLVR